MTDTYDLNQIQPIVSPSSTYRIATKASPGNRTLVCLFLVSLTIPVFFYLGPVRLSVYRILLIVALFPSLVKLFAERPTRFATFDLFIVLFAFWGAVTLLVAQGMALGMDPAGVFVVETLGSFFLARTAVRSASDFRYFISAWVLVVVLLIPPAVYEGGSGVPIIIELFSKIFTTIRDISIEGRLGINRTQVVFEHPILFGTFCAGAFGLSYFVLDSILWKRAGRSTLIMIAVAFSMSSGALLSIVLQVLLLIWEFFTRSIKHRWKILGGLVTAMYISISLLSNRSPFHVFVTYATFDLHSSYNRILIWNYGTASVWSHPILGIGLNDWERPSWMGGSMDNFWLVLAVRHGLPGLIFFVAAGAIILGRLGRAKLDPATSNCRAGLLISIAAMAISGATVHYWNATYCLFVFLLGSGTWMLDAPPTGDAEPSDRPVTPARAVGPLPIRYRET